MITFILVFFFGAFFPYFDFQQKKDGTLGDNIIKNLTELDRLTVEQQNISKSIQSYFDAPTLAAINDYKKLDDYFRKLELIQSKAVISSNNISASVLENTVPTFLECNKRYHLSINEWVSCNAEFVSEGTNKKIIYRYHPLWFQIYPLAQEAKVNLISFDLIASELVSDKNNEISSKLPPGIDPELWKKKIAESLGLMRTWEKNLDSTLEYVRDKNTAESLAWTLLKNPGGLKLTYNDVDRGNFTYVLNLLKENKNEVEKGIKGLSEKFEQVDFPVLGKVPVGLANAVIIYPAAIGVGCLICSYYLCQTISKRSLLHRKLGEEFEPRFGTELFPLWVEPLAKIRLRFVRLMLFVAIPLITLFVIAYLIYSVPIKQESIFGIVLDSVLITSCSFGFGLAILGAILVSKAVFGYRL